MKTIATNNPAPWPLASKAKIEAQALAEQFDVDATGVNIATVPFVVAAVACLGYVLMFLYTWGS